MDVCIYCENELAKMERNRAVCWECSDKKMTETYGEEEYEEGYKKELEDDSNKEQ